MDNYEVLTAEIDRLHTQLDCLFAGSDSTDESVGKMQQMVIAAQSHLADLQQDNHPTLLAYQSSVVEKMQHKLDIFSRPISVIYTQAKETYAFWHDL